VVIGGRVAHAGSVAGLDTGAPEQVRAFLAGAAA